jgi:8-oxo-dGTP pyrophosphatase MutT (NUDIX family)
MNHHPQYQNYQNYQNYPQKNHQTNQNHQNHQNNQNQTNQLRNYKDNSCNNCGKIGHFYHQCKLPIISFGVIAYREALHDGDQLRFLMIRRSHTLGFVDFIRGKYSIYNREYLLNLFQEMTVAEKECLKTQDFKHIWSKMWSKPKSKMSEGEYNEIVTSQDKFNTLKTGIINHVGEEYSIEQLIQDSNEFALYEEQEWGFPKGRREQHEKDYDCALREFAEETGYSPRYLMPIENLMPFEEIFMGSNLRSYKHKYFLMKMPDILPESERYDSFEVSKMEWKTFEECIACIRPYNLEKIRVIECVHACLSQYKVV